MSIKGEIAAIMFSTLSMAVLALVPFKHETLLIVGVAMFICAVAGLVPHLRGKLPSTKSEIAATAIFNGCFGAAWAALAFAWVGNDGYTESLYWFVIATSGMIGLGGRKAVERVIEVATRLGVGVVIGGDNDRSDDTKYD